MKLTMYMLRTDLESDNWGLREVMSEFTETPTLPFDNLQVALYIRQSPPTEPRWVRDFAGINDGQLTVPLRNSHSGRVFHIGLGVELNLTLPDLGHPNLPDLWDQLHGHGRTGTLQCLQCRDARPDCPEWMYLRVRRGRREAVHLNPSIEAHDAPESDEHKALKERIARAATAGGFDAIIEAPGPKRHRVTDVLVIGDGIKLGFEVQLASISVPTVKRRSAKATMDGVTPV